MGKKYRAMSLEEQLYSEQNIYLALYSVESYILNKELLSENDRIALNKLRDKFDKDNIFRWINEVKKRIHELMDENHYLKVDVFFKPKKYDKEKDEIIFRPLHSASLIEQITAVAMLNILIYDFDENNKVAKSSLSQLIPHNFYGNRIAYEPERLFRPWQEQYKQYTSQANELYRKYHENREFKWEVNLDLENFFPSINPVCLYNYIFQQISVAYDEDDRKTISKILEKLIFVKLNALSGKDLYHYTKREDMNKCIFALGIPQGMPQGYFLANLYMIEIEKIYKRTLSGESLFYVDDSVIFTNDITDIVDFAKKIDEINQNIEEWNRKLFDDSKEWINKEVASFIDESKLLYGIKIHEPGEKSTISNISDSKEGEIYIHCIGRETSKTAFEINTIYSDEESRMLFNKTKCILEAIEKELDKVSRELNSDSIDEEDKKYKESYKKKLIRYRKFFKYRNQDLFYRGQSDSNELEKQLNEDLKFLDNDNDIESIEQFFEKYNEDTLSATIGFVLKSMEDLGKDYSGIVGKIEKLNKRLFDGNENTKTSYLYNAYKKYIASKNPKVEQVNLTSVDEYNYLKELVKIIKPSTTKKTDDIRNNFVAMELKTVENPPINYIKEYMGDDYSKCVELVISNSDTLYRQLLNAVISYLCQIEISEDVVLQKRNNRKITYSELRLLEFLRNKYFSVQSFKEKYTEFMLDEYRIAIDYSIIQVLHIFKTYVCNPIYIDNLILVHKYTCDIWKNGSKHLYFYTLHNQEHAVDLIQSSIKVVRAIDYIDISKNDYYVLFIACYLHDISMVTFPNLDMIQEDTYESNKIYSDFIAKIKEEEKDSKLALIPVKMVLKEFYIKMDAFYEKLVRDSHAKNSAIEIRKRSELGFIDSSLREIVAEVSEAHGYNVNEIYKIKSNASSKLWSQKFTKIILRIADLLDMSNYRVSQLVLNHNLDNMSEVSRFHWLSHLVTQKYDITTEYFINSTPDLFLKSGSITEKIIFTIEVDLPQFTKTKKNQCKYMELKDVNEKQVILTCGEECNSDKCNFLCKWFAKKNGYLFLELDALKEYLDFIPDNYFKPEIEVRVKAGDKNNLTTQQFTLLKKYVEGE